MDKKYDLGKEGPQLWTREKAREIRARVEAALAELEPGDVLTIDAKRVQVFDYSFANELFGKAILNMAHDFPGRFLVIENLSTYTQENLVRALEGMNLMMIGRKGATLDLIGKVAPADTQTFRAIAKATEPVTAAELAKKLTIGLNAMNERLSKLTGLGVIRRERSASAAGREQYVYTVAR